MSAQVESLLNSSQRRRGWLRRYLGFVFGKGGVLLTLLKKRKLRKKAEIGYDLLQRYQDTRDLNDLEASVQILQEVVDLTRVDHPDRASWLQGLAASLGSRYRRLGDVKDLEAAVQKFQEAMDLTPADNPNRPSRLQSLALSLKDRYERLGELQDLEAALQRDQEAVELTPADHPDRVDWLNSLGVSFGYRYQRVGEVKDLEAALQKFQEAVDLTPVDHPARAVQLQNLATSFRDRYHRLGELKDLEAAVQKFQEAVDLTPSDHPDRACYVKGLAVSLTDRYQRLGDINDLEAALQGDQEAVDLTPADHPNRARRLQSLAVSLKDRYQRLGELKDLEAALQRDQEAVDLTPADHPDKARRLQSLAVSFGKRYWRLGELKDLEAALQRDQEAVDLTPAYHPARAGQLQGLAVSFKDRYRKLGELKDLEAALQKDQEAVDLTPANHPARAGRLQSLAVSFRDRYQRLGELKDLEASLQQNQEAVDLTPADHPDRAPRLQSLAVSLRDHYQRLGDLTDLEAAMQKFQAALDLTPADHPDLAYRLQGLAGSFTDRYEKLGELKDLEAALQKAQEAINLTPADHRGRAGRLQSLAASFRHLYARFKEPKHLKLVHTHYSDSFNTQAPSDPEPSWTAALSWALFSKEFEPAHCLTAYSAAFDLLPQLLWIGHTIPVRQDTIRRLDVGYVTSTATRTAITLSDLISAIQFFEQGLATAFQQMLQLKPNFDVVPSEQAKTLQKLSYELYSGTSDNPSRVARERQELLQKIRERPGLEHFLLPQPYKVLCQASRGGPVVMLNSHENGCDGIIILSPMSDPVHVAFLNLTLDLLKFRQKALKELLRHFNVRTRGEPVSTRMFGHREGFRSRPIEEHFTDLLTWLWNNVVEPIYQPCSLIQHNIHKGRLWWLPSGSFTGLPLHACPPTDDFIHSYTATLGSLLEAQAKKPSLADHKVGVVGVSYTSICRANYLKGVEQEVQNICSVIRDPNLECCEGDQATPTVVQKLLQNCSWVHLACHGTQDLNQPTKSHLLLYEGVLELETILRMPILNAEFVFLAACQTAMGDANLVNESFHLGGGFIAAGFRGAIGTLWSMTDEDGPLIAETIYSHLFRGGKQPQASDAAEALQLAMNKLKAQKVPYQRWIPFIHMGV
ncbi:CHAT domain-containing protein [Mycena maculata]|uniref:CHAT domain-containing protein n=1 Tax=Mycena maculata TaxID=230809 RepID=A0AAD7I8K7_9AGAR|nr:CHAT domain-containing protein [Mycena maculata]